MKYEKPNVVVFDAAIMAVQAHTAKTTTMVPDLSTNIFKSNAAYEADE